MEEIKIFLKIIYFFLKQKAFGKGNFVKGDKEKLVVLCNGPSINETIESAAKAEDADFLCVNLFPAKNEWFKKIKPRYLCVIDPIFYSVDGAKGESVKLLMQALENVTWEIYVINFINQKWDIKNSNVRYIHLNYNFYLGKQGKIIYRLYNSNLACVKCKNVSIASIFAGILMKYQEIEVYGIDTNAYLGVSVDESNHMIVKEQHFYGEKVCNYSELYPDVQSGGMELLFKDHMELFRAYKKLKEYAGNNSVKIINKTPGSYVDVFERE